MLSVKYGIILFDMMNNLKDEGVYESLWDDGVTYKLNETTEVNEYDRNKRMRVTTGLHCGSCTEWYRSGGDTTIAVEVLIEDVITFVDGSVRVKKLKVIDEYDPFDMLKVLGDFK